LKGKNIHPEGKGEKKKRVSLVLQQKKKGERGRNEKLGSPRGKNGSPGSAQKKA